MPKFLTQQKFEDKVHSKTKGEIKCLEAYKGSTKQHWWKHIPCGHQFPATPDNLYRHQYNCPRCNYHTDHRVERIVRVRCPKKHISLLKQSQVKDFCDGKIPCFICERTKVLDPQYKDVYVDFSFEERLVASFKELGL